MVATWRLELLPTLLTLTSALSCGSLSLGLPGAVLGGERVR